VVLSLRKADHFVYQVSKAEVKAVSFVSQRIVVGLFSSILAWSLGLLVK
jgi:hypothetical protein